MEPETISLSTVISIITPILTCLVGAVILLWRTQSEQHKKTEVRLESCNEEHLVSQKQFSDIKEELGTLKGRVEGRHEVVQMVKDNVSETIRKEMKELGDDIVSRVSGD